MLDVIRSDSRHYRGVLRKAAVDRIELPSIDIDDEEPDT